MELPSSLSVLSFNVELDPRSSQANIARLQEAAATAGEAADSADRRIALLPERWWRDDDEPAYRAAVQELAGRWSCWVVGGSMHAERHDGTTRNLGLLAAPDGSEHGTYEKRHPFAAEALAGVTAGTGPAGFDLDGVRITVAICADLFDPALFRGAGPDDPAAILVCAASTSRKPDPAFARALWTHVATARAWERNAHVAIADWAHAPHLPGVRTCGVSGHADPTRETPPFFAPTPAPAAWLHLPLGPLARLRRDRLSRNFLWPADPAGEAASNGSRRHPA
ncbi:MAG: carbon-nitrogen hydrolase family protein [Deltaproteobacteria bacterium]|nr:carbon-nitrogen hydrolase family protein [Deltaproteobacteria bacterium]